MIAERLRGSVAGAIGAQTSLDADAVTGLAASNLADILAEIAPLTGSIQSRAGSGQVLLVNGRRIGSVVEVATAEPANGEGANHVIWFARKP